MNQGWLYEEQVDGAGEGQTLLAYYCQRYRHSSEAEWRSRILDHQIWIDGQPAAADTRLRRGQILSYRRSPWKEPAAPLAFVVLYEDADLLAVAKPSGLPVLPGAGYLEHTLLGQLKCHYPDETPVPIHRLGRGTSGLVLLGRSPLAKAELTRQMRDRSLQKVYRALATGTTMAEQFTITTPIGTVPHPSLGHIFAAVDETAPSARFAQSDCRVIQKGVEATILEVTILTGRPHQIRIHLAAAGYPLVGDPLYVVGGQPRRSPHPGMGRLPVPGDCGYHLHAFRLSFMHPRSQQRLTLEAPLPEILEVV